MEQAPIHFIEKIAYAVGYDVSGDQNAFDYILNLIKGAIEDLKLSGVHPSQINSNNGLVNCAITQYCIDNLNMSSGGFRTSQTYIAVVHKLRLNGELEDQEEEENTSDTLE